jgi:hypothetical protein
LKFGQVVVVVQAIPAVTAARSQLAALAAIMHQEQSRFNQAGHIVSAPADRGPAIGHILVLQVWAVFLMSTVVTLAISVLQEAVAVGCVTAMHGDQDITILDALTATSADSLVLIWV